MIRYSYYSLQEVFEAITNRSYRLNDDRKFKRSARLTLFLEKGVTCVVCNLEANLFVLETHSQDVKPHLNLYWVNDDKTEFILFTKDHIIPKSLGGGNSQENYQTMCTHCNAEKGNSRTF